MREITTREELDKVLSENKNVLVDFWASWCGPCKTMIPRLEKMEGDYEDIVFVKFSVEEPDGKTVIKERGSSSLPTFLYFREGEEVGRLTGLRTTEEVQGLLEL